MRVAFQGRELVLIQFLGVKEQAAYECRLAVVHRTGGEQAKQVLLFVLVEVFFDRQLVAVYFQTFLVGVMAVGDLFRHDAMLC